MKLPFRPARALLFILFLLTTSTTIVAADGIVSETTTHPFPGIRILERVTDSPPQRIYAAFIEIDSASHFIDATKPTGKLRTVEEWAEETNALVAINGDFYRWNNGVVHLYGDAVGGGERWPNAQTGRNDQLTGEWFFNKYGWMAFGGKGATFTHSQWVKRNHEVTSGWEPDEEAPEIPPNTRALVSGFPQLVIDGKEISCDDPTDSSCFPDRSDMRARHPRTAIGLTRNHDTLILVVVDGRSKTSVGMYGTELAALMKELGAWNAINLDGGASSQMYVKGRGTINAPESTARRKVLNHLGALPKGGSSQ
ncbi:MAG TPA: phosphodiester glycosidase family protein [Opitutales bacterium]|nr:phosphodiester glycosidase family protein [Opitutales bacterium]